MVAFDRRLDRTSETVVDLDSRRVALWREVPNVQPPLMSEDATLADRVARGNEEWRSAVRARTGRGLEGVVNALMPSGNLDSVGVHPRTAILVSYEKVGDLNGYFRPIEGLAALIDLNNLKLIKLIEDKSFKYTELDRPEVTPDTAGLASRPASPGKPSIRREGHEIHWGRWSFRYSFNARKGLVLHDIRFKDDDRDRTVIARASLSEMVVPYGGASPTWRPRGPFDVGEFNLGLGAVDLVAGTVCPEDAAMLDVVLHDEFGRPRRRTGIVAVYERDGGVLWRHQDNRV